MTETDPSAADVGPSTDAPPASSLHVPPWVQLAGLPMLVLFGYLFVRAASHAMVVFLIAGLISLLLAPLVRGLAQVGIPRLLSVLIVFAGFSSLVAVLSLSAVDLLAKQAGEVRSSADDIGQVAISRIDDTQNFLDARGIRVDLRDQGIRFVDQLEERSTELSGSALELGREFVTLLAEAAFNLVLVMVITIYMLLDAPRISRLCASFMPQGSGIEVLFARMQHSLFRYTIGQTLASIVMGVSAAAGMWLMGVTGIWEAGERYAILFGLIVAITEFAPSIGPAIGSVPPILTALFDGPGAAIAVALFFLLLHQVEGHIVIPKLMGAAIAVHPLLVIFGIIAGAQIMGIGGILLALPILAVGREVVLYMRERIVLGRWPTEEPLSMFANAPVIATPDARLMAEPRTARPTSSSRRSRRTELIERLRSRATKARTTAPSSDASE